jgi:hypothetical protein
LGESNAYRKKAEIDDQKNGTDTLRHFGPSLTYFFSVAAIQLFVNEQTVTFSLFFSFFLDSKIPI